MIELRFFVGTPCRASNEADVQGRIQLLQNVGFYNPWCGGFLELVGPIFDFDENFDLTLAVAHRYEQWFSVLHCPFQKGDDLFSYRTDMSTQEGVSMAEKCVDMASSLGIKKVVLHTDVLAKTFPDDGKLLHRTQRQALLNIGTVAEYARDKRIDVCVENMARPGAFNPNGEHYVELMRYDDVFALAEDAAVHGFSITYDICHGATATRSVANQLKRLGDVIGHVHLSDTYPNKEYLVEGAVPVHPQSIIGENGWDEVLSAIPDQMTVTLEISDANLSNPIGSRQALNWIVRRVGACMVNS